MTVNLIKLCVGISNVDELRSWQRQRLKVMRAANAPARLVHTTRQMPKRRDELQAGGSIYWVIQGAIQVRQKIKAVEDGISSDGRKRCELVLAPKLVLVQVVPRRPFQGWRYLDGIEAPPDLRHDEAAAMAAMPERMRRKLLELALI